jgi:hypothetical protein
MLNVLIVGNASTSEMQPAVGFLADRNSIFAVDHASDVDAAVRIVNDGKSADLVVVCQHGPDEYSASDVRRLLSALPLARIVCCYGPWCASDGRTRDIWPPAVRVPASLAAGRFERELAVLRGEIAPLPLTASLDEIYEFDQL